MYGSIFLVTLQSNGGHDMHTSNALVTLTDILETTVCPVAQIEVDQAPLGHSIESPRALRRYQYRSHGRQIRGPCDKLP